MQIFQTDVCLRVSAPCSSFCLFCACTFQIFQTDVCLRVSFSLHAFWLNLNTNYFISTLQFLLFVFVCTFRLQSDFVCVYVCKRVYAKYIHTYIHMYIHTCSVHAEYKRVYVCITQICRSFQSLFTVHA